MNSKVFLGIRILLGLFVLIFGLNKFLNFIPAGGEMSEPAMNYFGGAILHLHHPIGGHCGNFSGTCAHFQQVWRLNGLGADECIRKCRAFSCHSGYRQHWTRFGTVDSQYLGIGRI